MTTQDTFNCPNCGYEMQTSEVIEKNVRQNLQQDFDLQKQRLVEQTKQQTEKEFADKLEHEKAQLSIDMADLQAQLIEKQQQVSIAQQKELELRKKSRQLEEQKQQMDLELARQLDQQKLQMKQTLSEQMHEEYRLQLQERDRQLDMLKQSLSELKRKSDVGSQEVQGELLEEELESILKQQFPGDTISAVPKGVRGADLLQEVMDEMRESCGLIIWEAKNTKNWSAGWIEKLKDDQRQCGAKLAVLVTNAMPSGVTGFAQIDGVWVCDINSYLGLTVALRQHLTELNFARRSSKGKNEKVELVYDYLAGDEFRGRIEAIVDSFNAMQEQLMKERRAMERIWKEREKQIQRITVNTVGMYGEMRGLIGSTVAQIPALELDDDL